MKPLESPISIRAYAKLLSVDEKAVRRAITEGKIKKGVEKKSGKIIPSKADAEWGSLHKTPKAQRGVSAAKAAQKLENAAPAKAQTKPPTKSQAKKEVLPVKEKEIEEVEDVLFEKDFDYTTFIQSVRIDSKMDYSQVIKQKEMLMAVDLRMKLEEKNGTLVLRDEVNKALFKVGDMLKKQLLNIPARVTADMRAVETEVEANNILAIEIQAVLSDIASLTYTPNAHS